MLLIWEICLICRTSTKPIGNWDVSNVTDMSAYVYGQLSFNQDYWELGCE